MVIFSEKNREKIQKKNPDRAGSDRPVTGIGYNSGMISNAVYFKYQDLVHTPVFMCAIPLFITIIFGLLASRNVRRISHRTVPLVRRRHEVQLTVMVLVQVIFNTFATTPSYIVRIMASESTLTNDQNTDAQMRFAFALTSCIYYLYYAVRFN